MTPISLAEVAANRRTIEAEVGLPPAADGRPPTLTVTYRVAAFTAADEARFQGVTAERVDDAFRRFLCGVVESWALTETTGGAVVPLEPDALAGISPTLLIHVYNAILTDLIDPKGSTMPAER